MSSAKNNPSLEHIRHSLAHLLAAAVLEQFPDAKLGIGPAIDTGFYYDIQFKSPLSPDGLPKLEARMRELVQANLAFTGRTVSAEEAKAALDVQPFKYELIDELAGKGEALTLYTTGNIFTDLCRGGHVDTTGQIPVDGFKLDKLAGAYWHGDEKNAQLTRIYGLAFESKQELENFLHMREEAEKRDHKIIGPQLDLFVFSDLVGAGLPLWTPKGTLMRNLLNQYVQELRTAHGYEQVEIPHITKKDLYERSGHWEKYQDELFKVVTREGHEFAMKPMNCPHHTQIYARRQWSYRQLPQRYANTTMCYRDEQTGELSGISRARAFTQDDAHVFCRISQVKEELLAIWDIIHTFYTSFGFSMNVRVSLRDPEHPEKYLGSTENWELAEKMLREVAQEAGLETFDGVGEAAFYGPKLDFITHDAIGRQLQIATIQLDMNQPERFDLTCINEAGQKERIVMIHAAIMGSIERFLSVAIEHFAGVFPTWLAPVQVAIIPVGEKFDEYAKNVQKELVDKNVRVQIFEATDPLGKRIRAAKEQKIPHMIVVGEKEQTSGNVAPQHFTRGQLPEIPVAQFVDEITTEIKNRSL